jgi:hypothetical protein
MRRIRIPRPGSDAAKQSLKSVVATVVGAVEDAEKVF